METPEEVQEEIETQPEPEVVEEVVEEPQIQIPAHFGSGSNIDVFGYKTKNFDVCGAAVKEFERVVNDIELEDDSLIKTKMKEALSSCAKFVDYIFGNEKEAVQDNFVFKSTFERICNDIQMVGIYAYKTTKKLNTSFLAVHVYEIALRLHPENIEENKDAILKDLSGGAQFNKGGKM